MSLPINPLGSATLLTSSASLSSMALNQTSSASTATSNVTMQPSVPPEQSASLQAALKALGAEGKLANDLQDVASALAPSMQKIIEERPDLAQASFDFQSDNGSIKVVSTSLNDHDKAWLQQTLNANPSLVKAVQTFHDDATSSYALWADAAGQPLSSPDTQKVSQLADSTFNFMDMLNRGSQAMAHVMGNNGSYTQPDGASINFHQSVNSALSFLVFQKSNQSILQGTDTDTDGSHVLYGAMKGNFFSSPGVIPGFVPETDSNSIGVSATA
ncbi:hypothetical protein [Dyella acidiphila]|uniref:Uncharacterized protein n=1 Tax=Dyella acidiphila TaxID=2775866 RepID=A0ABR9GEC2_9GAMM|nr:hypothetical protein [Dyella acidiphila]MBE1162383.1 hypothetical protein [Dyella acidiphila]